MVATPASPLGNGTYTVESTTLAEDGDIAHATWTFTVAIAATSTPTALPSAAATAAPSAAPTPVPATPVATVAPAPVAVGRWLDHGEWQRRRPADHRGAHRARRRGRVPPDPTQPPDRPGVSRGTRASVAASAARIVAALGAAMAIAFAVPAVVAAHTVNATYASRLPLAVYVVGAAVTVALSFIFVIVRDVRAAPPDLTAEGHLPPACAPLAAARARARGLGLDRRPGHRRRIERWRRRDAVPVGLRLGRARDRVRDHRPGLAIPRPVLDDPRHRRGASCGRSTSRAGTSPTTRPHSVAGRRRPGSSLLRLARARRPGGSVDPVHRPHRLHGSDRGDDGPVRARRMALPGGDVHRLVPDCSAGSPTGVSSTRRGGSTSARSAAACSSRAGPLRT